MVSCDHRLRQLLVPLVLILSNLLVGTVESAHVFDAYRLVQYDRNGKPYGSRRSQVYHMAAPAKLAKHGNLSSGSHEDAVGSKDKIKHSEEDKEKEASSSAKKKRRTSQGDLYRKAIMVRMENMNEAVLERLVDRRSATVVVIVLPSDLTTVPPPTLAKWRTFEQFLLTRQFTIPIYFAFEDEDVNGIIDALEAQGSSGKNGSNGGPSSPQQLIGSGERIQLVSGASDATLLPNINVLNLHGWLRGYGDGPGHDPLPEDDPTVAIVANYDTFAAAPGLAVGADHNASGTIALLEIARILGRLYSEFRTRGLHSILFILTSAGGMSFAGTKHWIRRVDSRVLEALEFVVCLEDLAHGSDLFLHASTSPEEDETLGSMVQNFKDSAAKMDVPLHVITTELNSSDSSVRWPHEQFTKKRITAVTVCNYREAKPLFSGGSIFDQFKLTSLEVLGRNIKIIVEALARFIYEKPEQYLNIVSHSHSVNQAFLASWASFMGSSPRGFPFLTEESPVSVELERALRKHTFEVRRESFQLESVYKFYKSSTYATTLTAFKVKSMSFDLLLSLAIMAYLLLLHLFLQYRSVGEFIKSLKPKKE